jgi:hypothetical protein
VSLSNGGSGGGETVPPTGGGSGITLITSEDETVVVTNPAGPTVDLSVPGGGGGGPVSLTGAGVTATPGILDQAGGMDIEDTEGDGFTVNSTGPITLSANGIHPISIGATVTIATGPGAGVDLPVTVVTGTNDQFRYIPVGTGIPETFIVAPGVCATLPDVADAWAAAVGTDSDTFGDYVVPEVLGGQLIVIDGSVGDAISAGDANDFLVSIGYTSPPYFFEPNGGIIISGAIGFFDDAPQPQAPAPTSTQDIANALAAYGLLAGPGTVDPPGGLLGSTTYEGGDYTVAQSATVVTILDVDNLIVAFTAPASGAVDVTLEGYWNLASSAATRNILTWGLQSTDGLTSYGPLKRITDTNGATVDGAQYLRTQIVIHVDGLTPGDDYTFAWAAGNFPVAGALDVTMSGDDGSSIASGTGPFEMRVRSA